jgi:hypothetical protein
MISIQLPVAHIISIIAIAQDEIPVLQFQAIDLLYNLVVARWRYR